MKCESDNVNKSSNLAVCGAEAGNYPDGNLPVMCLIQVGCDQILAHTDPIQGLAALVGELTVSVWSSI